MMDIFYAVALLPQGSPIYIFSESIYNNFICAIIDD